MIFLLAMNYHTILRELTEKKYAPVYFLQGTEPFYTNSLINFMENNIVPQEAKTFDMTTFYGQDSRLNQIIIQAKRFPILAPYQVVLVKEAQVLQDLHKEAGQKYLLQYLDNPNPQTLLVFAYKEKTLDQRKAFTKQLSKKTIFFTGNKVYEKELPHWIQTHIQGKGYDVDSEAIHMLTTLIGENLQILANEIEKITVGLPEGTLITLPMVRQHVSQTKSFDIFDLQQAIQKHDTDCIWTVTEHFIKNKKKYPLIPQITLLTNFFTKLLMLHSTPNATTSQIASKLHIPIYFAKNYRVALQHYDFPKTVQNLQYLHQADLQLKGIGYPPTPESTILKTLVSKLINHQSSNPLSE